MPRRPRTPIKHTIAVGPRLQLIVEILYRARLAALIEGGTGVGKSESAVQAARALGIGVVVLDLAILDLGDLIGMPREIDGRTVHALPEWFPTEGCGLIILEELNRAAPYMQHPALQLLTARMLHQHKLPEGWSVLALVNPEDDGGYQVHAMDPALRARFHQICVHAERATWLAWAADAGVHPSVRRVVGAHDRALADVPPRTWTYASRVLDALTPQERGNQDLMRDLLHGYLSGAWLELVLQESIELDELASLEERLLLSRYRSRPGLREGIRRLIEDGRTDALDTLYRRLHALLAGPELRTLVMEQLFDLASFEALLADLPGDLREGLQEAFGGNPAAASALPVRTSQIREQYRRSIARRQVKAWCDTPSLRHRVDALLRGVARDVDEMPGPIVVQSDPALIENLRVFVEDAGPDRSDPLLEALLVKNVDLETSLPL